MHGVRATPEQNMCVYLPVSGGEILAKEKLAETEAPALTGHDGLFSRH